MKLCTILLLLVITVSSCKKEAEPQCVTWIVGDYWETANGHSLKDYNSKYGYVSARDMNVCGAAKDTIFEGKKVVLRTMHDTAFYVREYIEMRIK